MRRLLPLFAAIAASGAISGACRPDFDERESFVDRTMVLGVRVDPPEAKPGEVVTTTLLVATPSGPLDAPAASFAFCTTPKLLTENGSVSASCQRDGVAPIGEARGPIAAALPPDACSTFGPEVAAAELRPRDPDSTGGFYQPIRARLSAPSSDAPSETITAFGFARVRCNLKNAPADAATRFAAEYRLNRNPSLLPLEARVDGALAAFDAIPRGATVVLRAAWRPEDAEIYVAFDPSTQAIVQRRETMRVSWFTTAGSLQADRTGRGEAEIEAFSENTWTAPSEAGRAHLFAVLRDARGGMAFASAIVDVR